MEIQQEPQRPELRRQLREKAPPTSEPTKQPAFEETYSSKYSPANQTCWYLGGLFLVIDLVGFVVPRLFEAHLSPALNLIHIASGIAALWFGLATLAPTAKKFCYLLGGFYVLLGIAGFIFGHTPTGSAEIAIQGRYLIKFIPEKLELGMSDHILHIIFGVIFLLAAYFTLRKKSTT